MVGTSRKSFIGQLTGNPPAERLYGTLGSLASACLAGARIFRVHDVAAAREFLSVFLAIQELSPVSGRPVNDGGLVTAIGRAVVRDPARRGQKKFSAAVAFDYRRAACGTADRGHRGSSSYPQGTRDPSGVPGKSRPTSAGKGRCAEIGGNRGYANDRTPCRRRGADRCL